jgi:hypothetical protein
MNFRKDLILNYFLLFKENDTHFYQWANRIINLPIF